MICFGCVFLWQIFGAWKFDSVIGVYELDSPAIFKLLSVSKRLQEISITYKQEIMTPRMHSSFPDFNFEFI